MKPELSFNDEYGVTIMRIPKDTGFSDKIDEKESGEFIVGLLELLDRGEHRYLLCNVSGSANSRSSKEMRRWITKQGERMRLEKTAVVGASSVMRMIAKVMVAAIGQSEKTRFFKTEGEALRWFALSMVETEIRK